MKNTQFEYLGPILWSKIPSKDRLAASVKQFKTQIRSLDLSNILDDVVAATFKIVILKFLNYAFNYKILEFW